MHVAHIRQHDNKLMVSGRLSFANVMLLLRDSLPLIKRTQVLEFDFSQVTSSDSAGLALIIEWVKLARAQHKSIKLHHLSGELMSLASACSLDKIINSL